MIYLIVIVTKPVIVHKIELKVIEKLYLINCRAKVYSKHSEHLNMCLL